MKVITKDEKEYIQETVTVEYDKEYYQIQLDSINGEMEHMLEEKKELENKIKLFN